MRSVPIASYPHLVLAAGPWLPFLACSGNFSSFFYSSALYFPHSVCEQQPNLVQHVCHGPLLFLKRGPHPNSCPPLSSQAFILGGGQESNPKHRARYTSFLLLCYTGDSRLSSQPPSCFFSFFILCASRVCMRAPVMPGVEVREQLAGVALSFYHVGPKP